MRRITYRFVLLIASAAIAPLLLYGIISIRNLQQGTESTVREGNRRLANQVSEEIGQYMEHNTRVLKSVGLVLRGTNMEQWQQTQVLKDFRIDFPEFREITFFSAGGRVIATSRAGRDSPLDTDRRSHRQQRRFHSAARSRRGQPAAHDDCRPHRSGRAGAGLDCR